MWIEIFQPNAKSFLLGCLYRPPESSLYLPEYFNKHFDEMLKTVNELSVEAIIMGDINVNFLKKNVCKELKDIISINGYEQLIKIPTRTTQDSSTLIDVILTNYKSTISNSDVMPLSLSDHDMIGCVRKLNHLKFKKQTIRCRNYRN